VSGRTYHIRTDHYSWFRFAELLKHIGTTYGEFDFLYIEDEKPFNRKEGFEQLMKFFYEKRLLPRPDHSSTDTKEIIDYVLDADLIYSAIMQCYGVDLYDKPIHWHKVRAMINGLVGTKYNDILYYRACKYDSKDKELMKLKRAWALPEVEDPTIKAKREAFNKLFETKKA
jgi:hypothetical protein